MNQLFKTFINQDISNKRIYDDYLKSKDIKLKKIIDNKFNNFLIKVSFYSYINKTLYYSSLNFKKKAYHIHNNELLILNKTYKDSEEELINTLTLEDNFDYDINMDNHNYKYDWNSLLSNELLLDGIYSLTEKQKFILYMNIVEEKTEIQIAKELNISKQAVNKTKNTALKKLNKLIGGENYGKFL